MPDEIVEVTRRTPFADLPEWLSVQEAAALLGLSAWTVYQNLHKGEIPYRRVGPKTIQIPKGYFHRDKAQQQVTT
jgi:excisionase family DNA binding protein